MALALYMGISANTSYCAAGAYDALSRSGAAVWNYGPKKVWDYGAKAWNYGAGSLVGRGLSATINIPSYIWNKVSSWSSTTQVSVLAVLLTTLAAGYKNREACKQWFDNIFDQIWPETSEPPMRRETSEPSMRIMDREEGEKFKNYLQGRDYKVDAIQHLQNKYKNYKNLDAVLLQYYRDEYQKKLENTSINDKLEKIKEFIRIVSDPNSPQKKEILQKAGLAAQGVLAPSTIGEFDGLNWGENGLRYQALNGILNNMKKLQ
jgi:hypothetical protein